MKKYSKELKEKAVKMVSAIGIAETAKTLDIPTRALYSWNSQTKKYGENAYIGTGRKRPKANEEAEKTAKLFEQNVELVEMNTELIELLNKRNKENDKYEGVCQIIRKALDMLSEQEAISEHVTVSESENAPSN